VLASPAASTSSSSSTTACSEQLLTQCIALLHNLLLDLRLFALLVVPA
jgi:hypothetical protein